jgi:ATP-binding cassette subfamily F protein 3
MLLVSSNLLLMDEPTNHLDLDSTEMLIEALQGYGGTLVCVSYNRSFVNGLSTHVWDVVGGKVETHPGNLDDYLYHQEQRRLAAGLGERLAEKSPTAGMSEKERKRMEAEARQKRSAVEGPIKRRSRSWRRRSPSWRRRRKSARSSWRIRCSTTTSRRPSR